MGLELHVVLGIGLVLHSYMYVLVVCNPSIIEVVRIFEVAKPTAQNMLLLV